MIDPYHCMRLSVCDVYRYVWCGRLWGGWRNALHVGRRGCAEQAPTDRVRDSFVPTASHRALTVFLATLRNLSAPATADHPAQPGQARGVAVQQRLRLLLPGAREKHRNTTRCALAEAPCAWRRLLKPQVSDELALTQRHHADTTLTQCTQQRNNTTAGGPPRARGGVEVLRVPNQQGARAGGIIFSRPHSKLISGLLLT